MAKKKQTREATLRYRLSIQNDPIRKELYKQKRHAYVLKNKEKLKAIDKKSYEKRKEKILAQKKEYVEKNKDKILISQARHRNKNRNKAREYRHKYQKEHAGKMMAYKIKRKIRLQSSPLTNIYCNDIDKIYQKRPENQVVDHILPLQGKDISGLHVPWNLQYLSWEENNVKRHSFDGTNDNESWRKRFL